MLKEKKYGTRFELEVYDAGICANGGWHWELINCHLYICSYNKTDGYRTKAGARRAALNVAHKLKLQLNRKPL